MECLVCREEIQPSDTACPQCGFPVNEDVTLAAAAPVADRRPDRRLMIAIGAGVGAVGLTALVVGVLVGRMSAPAPQVQTLSTFAPAPTQGVPLPAPPTAAPPPAHPAVTRVLRQPLPSQQNEVWDRDGDGWVDSRRSRQPVRHAAEMEPLAPSHLIVTNSHRRHGAVVTVQPVGFPVTDVTVEIVRNSASAAARF
jgi:hypothetical protein